MKSFYHLLAVVVLTLLAVLAWDLGKRRVQHGDKQLIIYAGMFGPGEPIQRLYSGPPRSIEPEHPFGPDAAEHYAALAQAWPALAATIGANYQKAFGYPLSAVPAPVEPGPLEPSADASDVSTAAETADGPAEAFEALPLVERYRRLSPQYVEQLVDALGRHDRANRMALFGRFADLHPSLDARLIPIFEGLHPAYTVGLFEDFRRRHPEYEIEERWDGRWVLSANRGRFLTGSDVPDLVGGAFSELRILYQENLAVPLDKPLPEADDPAWREKGILDGTPAYSRPGLTLRDTFHPWAIEASTYTIMPEDVEKNGHPYPVGTRIAYLYPSISHSQVIFYNRAHFRRIGRDPDDVPKTVEEFEEICRQIRAAGLEPIAQDGMTYIENWWNDMVSRTLSFETYYATCSGERPRFAGPDGDPRYLEIARHLRRWRDEGFWMNGFSASKWPGAQRDFGTGQCTFLFTGTWLPAEIAQTRSYDPEVFDLSCFIFPAVVGGQGSPSQITVGAQGHAITRQGRNLVGAVKLLSFLSTYGARMESERLRYTSAQRHVPFPQEVASIERILNEARPGDIVTEGIISMLPKFNKFVLLETFSKYFVIRSDNLTPEEFVQALERKAQDHYARYGKGT